MTARTMLRATPACKQRRAWNGSQNKPQAAKQGALALPVSLVQLPGSKQCCQRTTPLPSSPEAVGQAEAGGGGGLGHSQQQAAGGPQAAEQSRGLRTRVSNTVVQSGAARYAEHGCSRRRRPPACTCRPPALPPLAALVASASARIVSKCQMDVAATSTLLCMEAVVAARQCGREGRGGRTGSRAREQSERAARCSTALRH